MRGLKETPVGKIGIGAGACDMTGRLNKQRVCISLQTIRARRARPSPRAIGSGSAVVQTTLSNSRGRRIDKD